MIGRLDVVRSQAAACVRLVPDYRLEATPEVSLRDLGRFRERLREHTVYSGAHRFLLKTAIMRFFLCFPLFVVVVVPLSSPGHVVQSESTVLCSSDLRASHVQPQHIADST